jgi:hypothetical protein
MNMRKSFGMLAATLVISLMMTGIALGWGESNPRALGMGGAYTALARSMEAPYWNPANLGFSRGMDFSINIFNAGAGLRNNSFSLSDYNKYNGEFLTDGDKEDILGSIPAEGLTLDILAEASALNFSVGNFAVTCKGYGATNANIDRDPIELLFYGNAVVREVSFSNAYSEAYAIGDAALSYGRPLMQWDNGEFTVGASAHYLRGIAYQKILESEGGVVTTDTGFVGDGRLLMRTARGGSGLAFDLGLAARFEDSWYFSAAWQNCFSKLFWNTKTEEMLYTFDMQPVTVESAADSLLNDSLVTTADSTYSVDGFSSDLPSVIQLGLAKHYEKLTWSLDWSQSLASRPGHGINPRIAAGIEYRPATVIPLRAGMAFGGNQGSIYSFGFGLHFGPYNFDLGLANSGSPVPTDTKGARLAVGMGLFF